MISRYTKSSLLLIILHLSVCDCNYSNIFPMKEEFPVSVGQKLVLKSMPFVNTRYYHWDGLVRSSDRKLRWMPTAVLACISVVRPEYRGRVCRIE